MSDLVPSKVETQRQCDFFERLQAIVASHWPTAKLHLYGSCANTFGGRNSDIDVCLAVEEEGVVKAEAVTKMATILREENMQNVQVLLSNSLHFFSF